MSGFVSQMSGFVFTIKMSGFLFILKNVWISVHSVNVWISVQYMKRPDFCPVYNAILYWQASKMTCVAGL